MDIELARAIPFLVFIQKWKAENTGRMEVMRINWGESVTITINHRDNPPEDATTYTLAEVGWDGETPSRLVDRLIQ
tara:strand:+ start:662 stop:889 length:228 start_codon:yes stop_codon:yes gene_type:complete